MAGFGDQLDFRACTGAALRCPMPPLCAVAHTHAQAGTARSSLGEPIDSPNNRTPLISLLTGILILLVPRLLNYIVAIYLIAVGLIGILGAGAMRLN